MIETTDLSFGYGAKQVLDGLSLRFENAQVTGLIGVNGAGKSTLIKLMARILKPDKGTVTVDERPAEGCPPLTFARQLAYLPQNRPIPEMTVRALVQTGRYAHRWRGMEEAERAMRETGILPLADRCVDTLSGGQRQKAYLAMLLAQGSPNVLLDEPFTHLDAGAQLEVLDVIRRMKDGGKCVAVVMHDLTLAEKCCDRVVLLDKGKAAFDGLPGDCLRSEALENAFGVRMVENAGWTFEKR